MVARHGSRWWNGGGLGRAVLFCAGIAGACWSQAAAAADAAPKSRPPRTAVVDPAVVPAGGVCRGCREPHCRACHPGGHHRHHAGCRDGKCHPYCPVRPQEFGFYGTQWRRWPGQGVVPVANVQDATPARPPKSAVPRADEESRGPRADELPAPEPDAAPATPRQPVDEPAPPSAEPAPPAEPIREPAEPAPLPIEDPAAGKATGEPAAPTPPAAEPPAKQPAADDNLFDESATGPVPRRFVASRGATAAAKPVSPEVRPATLTYPVSVERLPKSVERDPLRVPRVPFDPTVEAAGLSR
jgi:hypothetical protein